EDERHREERPRGKELSDDDVTDAHGVREQELLRPAAPFLRPEPHRHERNEEHERPREELEHPLHVRALAREEGLDLEEEDRDGDEERAEEHVGDRRVPVRAVLAARDRERGLHARGLPSPTVSRWKHSSSVSFSRWSSESRAPRAANADATRSHASSPP